MTDTFSKADRSRIMSKVRSTDTKPEILVRKFLFSKGLRFRKNVVSLPGKPDIVLSKYKTAIFIHGCYWHGHSNCQHSDLPKSNLQYWSEKIKKNINRDQKSISNLESLGWHVIVLWECEINKKSHVLDTLDNLYAIIKKSG